ncbi:MAG TPA: peptidoglycan-binding protein [Mycobacteriales bacterium]|nr:peptidoglycan-binding protein [Mycobacteriales bacterium]
MPASSPRSRVLGTLVAGALCAGLLGTTAAPAAAAPVAAGTRTAAAATPAVPAVPSGLPTAIEPLARYVAQADCDPSTKPGVTKLGKLLTATYPNTTFGGGRACTDRAPSEHYDGRAVDWMNSVRNSTQKAQAEVLLKWLFAKDAQGNPYANARRLGVMYIIWNNKIWGSYNTAWQPYNNCAATPAKSGDTTCHRDHMHLSLSWEGAMGRTSYWTKKVAGTDYGPCRPADLNWAPNYTAPNTAGCTRYAKITAASGDSAVRTRAVLFSGAQLARGYTGQPVVALQNALKVPATATYDAATVTAVRALQTKYKLRVNGIMNAATWRALLADLPRATPPTVTAALRTFNTATGVWTTSTGVKTIWGAKGDRPVVGDYDGNGATELALYRPSTSQWPARTGAATTFGQPGDVPVPGKYRSTTRDDLAVYRPGTSTWHVRDLGATVLGKPGDIPVPADYDGDGLTERATYRPSTGTWTIEGQKPVRWGGVEDIPVPADYNGDGKDEIAVFRPSTSQWRVTTAASVNFGKPGDIPVPLRYDGGKTADRAVFRPSTGEWHVKLATTVVVKGKVRGTAEVPAGG